MKPKSNEYGGTHAPVDGGAHTTRLLRPSWTSSRTTGGCWRRGCCESARQWDPSGNVLSYRSYNLFAGGASTASTTHTLPAARQTLSFHSGCKAETASREPMH